MLTTCVYVVLVSHPYLQYCIYGIGSSANCVDKFIKPLYVGLHSLIFVGWTNTVNFLMLHMHYTVRTFIHSYLNILFHLSDGISCINELIIILVYKHVYVTI